ncbi:MAG: signal peptidase II [Deltaproteobacteria bacterium]|nr:signal peptidase II [Deltaproteobacteria bacterium]
MHGGVEIKNTYKILLITAAVVVVLDQASKAAVMGNLSQDQIIEVISGFFDLVYFRNPGAAFGIFNEGGLLRKLFLIATSSAALIVIWTLLKQSKDTAVSFGLSLIAGGAVGNLIDRIRFGSVVDFLYFHIGSYYWPAFNIADSAITVGVVIAAFFFYFRHQK